MTRRVPTRPATRWATAIACAALVFAGLALAVVAAG
jgi:hypothetical protein